MSVQLVSKISNLCDPDPPTLQTDRQTDGQTDRRTDEMQNPNTALCTSASRGNNNSWYDTTALCNLLTMAKKHTNNSQSSLRTDNNNNNNHNDSALVRTEPLREFTRFRRWIQNSIKLMKTEMTLYNYISITLRNLVSVSTSQRAIFTEFNVDDDDGCCLIQKSQTYLA